MLFLHQLLLTTGHVADFLRPAGGFHPAFSFLADLVGVRDQLHEDTFMDLSQSIHQLYVDLPESGDTDQILVADEIYVDPVLATGLDDIQEIDVDPVRQQDLLTGLADPAAGVVVRGEEHEIFQRLREKSHRFLQQCYCNDYGDPHKGQQP